MITTNKIYHTSEFTNRCNHAQTIWFKVVKNGDYYVPSVQNKLYPSGQSLNFVTAMENAEKMAKHDAFQYNKHGIRAIARRAKSVS